MIDEVRALKNKVLGMVSRAVLGSRASDGTYQADWSADRTSAGVELLQPQGLHFRAPVGADGVLLSPAGNKSASVLLCATSDTPSDATTAGEGGLHYLGTYKVFLKSDGTVSIGAFSASQWAAVASLVDARISAIVAAFNTHAHTGVTTGMGTSGTPASPLGAQASVASTKVRIEP